MIINIIIFIVIIGYILKNLSKLTSQSSEEKSEEPAYRADNDEIKHFLEKMKPVKEQQQSAEEVTPVFKEDFTSVFENDLLSEKTLEPELPDRVFTPIPTLAVRLRKTPKPRKNTEKKGEPPQGGTPFEPQIQTYSGLAPAQDSRRHINHEQLRQGVILSIILGPPRSRQPHRLHKLS